jgi:FkbM family methyltransferase
MILSFDKVIEKTKISLKGIIHAGGATGEEIPLYKQYTNNIHIFEPQKDCFDQIPNDVKKYNCALGEAQKVCNLYLANNKHCASLLKPKLHLEEHKEVIFDGSIIVPVYTLDFFNITDCNFLNMDVQGYELNILKGAEKTLEHIDAIYTEVNTVEIYENNSMLNEMDMWLAEKNYKRVWLEFTNHRWGDALYVR